MKAISVIMPAYNAQRTIETAINSVLCQTYNNLELIVVDDASTDNTSEIVKKLCQKDNRIKLVSLPENKGVANARNVGVKEAKNELIAFLDSDDCWKDEKLECQIKTLEQHPECDICFTATAYVSSQWMRSDYILRVPEKVTYNDILKQNIISCSSVLVTKKAMLENPMPTNKDIHEDFATWLSILKKSPYAVGVNKPLLLYRVSANGKSGDKLKSARMQIRTYKVSRVPFFKAFTSFFAYAYRNIRKYNSLKIGR